MEKFQFSPEFQLELIKLVLRDSSGYLYVNRLKSTYLTLISHQVIYSAIKQYFRERSTFPGLPSVLNELVLSESKKQKFSSKLTKEDLPKISSIINYLYDSKLTDTDHLKSELIKFSTFVKTKDLISEFDITNFGSYRTFQEKYSKILTEANSVEDKQNSPLFLVKGVTDRQLVRRADPTVVPSPFKGLNRLTNGGGFPKNSILVILDKPKAKKTFALVNLARAYLALKKNVLIIDLENGKEEYMDRVVQSTMNKSYKQMATGDYDKQEKKHVRKISRFGVELVVERLSAKVHDANDIRDLILKLKNEHGITIDILVVDYAAKLASINKDKEDTTRIDNVYIDLANLAKDMDIDHLWTAQHITRDGEKHRATRYESNDIASAITIVRNAQGIFGLNSSKEEEENGYLRMEVVDQRNGVPYGRALFHFNAETQRMKEFTNEEVEEYNKAYLETLEGKIRGEKQKGSDKPWERTKVARPERKKHGDIG